jgi:hypothetical protein
VLPKVPPKLDITIGGGGVYSRPQYHVQPYCPDPFTSWLYGFSASGP